MRKPFLITTPYPTVEEVARRSGVSQTRMKELIAIADEFLREHRDSTDARVANKASKKRSARRIARKEPT